VKDELETQLKMLAKITKDNYTKIEDVGVLAGQSGIALFQFYCAQYFNEDSYSDTGVEIIGSCIDKINNGYSFPTYSNGIAGLGWVLQHLIDEDFIELDLNSFFEPFNDYLHKQLKAAISYNRFDFLHGAMGYGFYFLKRFQSTKDEKVKTKFLQLVKETVLGIEAMAIAENGALKWESVLELEKGNKGYNLSFSHGISSIVNFLCRVHEAQIMEDTTAYLISGALEYMGKFEDMERKDVSLFPSWITPDKELQYKSRIAWCYGDIGIGLSFKAGAEVLKNANFKRKATEILIHSATRTASDKSFVVDSGFCHGSFGNSHIFRTLSKHYSEESFLTTADFWLAKGIKQYSGDPKRPYLQWSGMHNTWEMNLNLLEGVSGIGLVMLDYLTEGKSTWDECLLMPSIVKNR